jgi:hypothetical protein
MVKNLNGDKARGLMVFLGVFFFHKCWENLKEDIMAFFREFRSKRRFEKSIIASFISLIP